jgi:hypothetical protein
MSNKPYFIVEQVNPIFTLNPKYSSKTCIYCRGSVYSNCFDCQDKLESIELARLAQKRNIKHMEIECVIVDKDEKTYHKHCCELVKKNN